MEDPGTAETLAAFKDTRSQELDVREEETKCKETVIEHKKAIEDKYLKCTSSSYGIMTFNMDRNKKCKANANKRKELIISTIECFPASVIFCQELPGKFKKEVVEKCGYEFAFTGTEAAVMWRGSNFDSDPVKGTDSSITEIVERLQRKDSGVDVSEVSKRTNMVKLTSRSTGASFLAVSWHGPWNAPGGGKRSLESKQKAFNGLICFLCEVCKKKELSSFIIGGDFNLDATKEDSRKDVTISGYELCTRDKKRVEPKPAGRYPFVPYKDTFIVSVTVPSGKRPTGDITVSSVRPRDFENKSSEEETLLGHVPVVGVLELVWPYKKLSIKQDRENEENDNTNEKESESSMRAMGDHDNQIKLIESYVSRELGKQRKTVPGDGHCMLHAFSLGLREKDDHSDYSVTTLSTQIREEILGNIEFYSQFVGDKDRLVSDLDSYINDNKYDSEVVDLMLHALATVTNTSVSVLGVHEGQVHTLIIDPRGGGSKRTIFICKIGMHYDAILHQDEEAAICEEKYRQDTKKSHITKKTTNEKNRLELTPETTVRTAKASSSALGPRRLHFGEDVSNPSKRQSPSAIHDGCITGKDFEKLFNLVENLSKSVESLHAKVDRQTTEIVEIKSAMQRLDGPHTGVSQPPPTEPHSQTTNVLASSLLEQGSDRAEEQDALLTSGTKQRKVHTCKKCGKPVKGHRKDKNGSLVCPPDAEK